MSASARGPIGKTAASSRLALAAALFLARPDPAPATTLGNVLDLALTATVESDAYAHPGEPGERLLGRLELEALWAPLAWGEIVANAALAIDSDGEIERSLAPDWAERAPAPRSLEVSELAAVGHFSLGDVSAGKLVASWGVGDVLQPTDCVTPVDLTDPLRDRRLGAPGLLLELYPGGLELDLAWVRHAPHRLPPAGSRWFPIAGAAKLELDSELPSGPGARVLAARLRGSGRGFDWAATARRGPDLAPHVGFGKAEPFLFYPDLTLVGGSLAVARGELVLRAELAARFYDQDDRGSREDFATLLVGGERRFPGLVFGTDATVIVELVRDQHLGGTRLPRQLAVIDPLRLLETGLSLRLLSHDPTGWEVEAGWVADLSGGGGIAQLLLRRNLGDRADLELGIDLLEAGGNAALAPLEDNDRASLRIVGHL